MQRRELSFPCPAFHKQHSSTTQIAVLKEVEGKGPFCSLVMAVVVVKDLIVIMAFALNIELIRAVGGGGSSRAGWVDVRVAGSSRVGRWVGGLVGR